MLPGSSRRYDPRVDATTGKPIIGLSGGIGAGKSTVAAAFEALGCLVISSDRLNHEILDEPEVLATLRGWWGAAVSADGRADRRWIAARVFDDPAARARLESITHPLIAARRADMIRSGNKNPAIKAIILDSPLLFESNLDRLCSKTVFVEADETERLERLQRSRGWSSEDVRRRERWQLPLVEKRSRSDVILRNDGTPGELQSKVREVLNAIVQAS